MKGHGVPNHADGTEHGTKKEHGVPNRADGTVLGPKDGKHGIPNRADRTEQGLKFENQGIPNRVQPESGDKKPPVGSTNNADRSQTEFAPKDGSRVGVENRADAMDGIKQTIKDFFRDWSR